MEDMSQIDEDKRSKSQLSIFEYPEHLNPFYEDENHKRLRFWKIGKNKNGTSSRRGSFSLDGLRDMWSFKSFRGKKKSSTLGINKTSESPEPLRRSAGGNESLYATYDPRHRNTYDNNTLNGNFQRNIPYRTSLQNMTYSKNIDSNGNGIGFMRNDNYRSTIQITGRHNNLNNNNSYSGYNTTPTVPPRRYVYGGSVTPQPRSRFDHNTSYSQEFSRGSSQLSVASSTNPFEYDDDNDNESIITGRLSSCGENSERPTPTKRIAKKKRRAPPPPVPIPKILDEEPIGTPTSPANTGATSSIQIITSTPTIITESKVKLAATPTPPSSPIDDENLTSQNQHFENQLAQQMKKTREFSEQEKLEISNIAAEIEHYVKLLSQDDDDVSSIRLIPVAKPFVPVLKKAKSSNSLEQLHNTDTIKKSGSENFMKALSKKNMGPTKADLTKWRESSLKLKNAECAGKFAEIRRLSLGKPTPAFRQRQSESPTSDSSKDPERKSSSPEVKITSVEMKPIPTTRHHSPKKSAVLKESSSPKKELVSNDVLPNISAQQIDLKNNNNYDHCSSSSKENTPPNSSYDTTTDESVSRGIELKITESREDVSEISNNSSEHYHIRYVPLKEGTPESPPQLRRELIMEEKPVNFNGSNKKPSAMIFQSTYNEGWVSGQEPRRSSVGSRRSVKEIIESINRSQSLLKVNQDQRNSSKYGIASMVVNNLNGNEPSSPPRRSSNDKAELDQTYRQLAQEEAEIKRMIVEMEGLTNNREMDNYCDNVPSILDRFDEEVNNNDIFKKCVLKKQMIREGSPTASNLDWNPLPKPKRSKNLSVVLNNDVEKPNGQ